MHDQHSDDPFERRGPAYRVPAERQRQAATSHHKLGWILAIAIAIHGYALYNELGGCGWDLGGLCSLLSAVVLFYTSLLALITGPTIFYFRDRVPARLVAAGLWLTAQSIIGYFWRLH